MGDQLLHLQTLVGHTDRVWHLAWSPDGSALASCGSDRTVRIWQRGRQEGSGWRCAAVLEDSHTKSIRCCCWSPGGTHLATASFDGTTCIWRLQAGVWEEVCRLDGHENEVKAVAWSPCGNYLATCGRDKSIWFWERGPGEEFDCLDVKHGHSQDVKSVAWHPLGRELLASCSYDDTVKLWVNDDGDWVCAQTLEGPAVGHSSTVWAVAFSRDGRRLASVSDDRTLRVWRLEWRGELPPEPHCSLLACISGHHQRTIFSVDWSPQDVVATGDGANAIKLFAQEGGSSSSSRGEGAEGQAPGGEGHGSPAVEADGACEPAPWRCLGGAEQAHECDVNCVRWHPQVPGLLASGGDDGAVKLWVRQPPGGEQQAAAAATAAGFAAAAVARAGGGVASGGAAAG